MTQSFTPMQRLVARLNGQAADRAPNFDIIMGFGVRHIGATLRDYYLDYRTLVRMNLAMLNDLELDLVQVISDPYREAVDWGLDVEFPEDNLPLRRRPLLETPGDLAKLKRPDPASSRRMSDRLEAIRALKEQVGAELPVMGWVEGALAELHDLRGDTALMTDFYDRPDWLAESLEMLAEVQIDFARAQVSAGADIIGLGDAIASTISPGMYRTYALPYEQRIFAAVREMGAIPRLHICGNTTRILEDMILNSGAAIVDLDWMVDFGQAALLLAQAGPGSWPPVEQPPAAGKARLAPALSICGNFDPVRVMLQGTPDEVYQATWDNLARGGPRCISMPGCEVPVGTPPENIQAQNRAIRRYGQ